MYSTPSEKIGKETIYEESGETIYLSPRHRPIPVEDFESNGFRSV